MVNEVEDILQEIRERVRAEEGSRGSSNSLAKAVEERGHENALAASTDNSGHLERVSAHLTTTARAWHSLPPIFSNRRGALAGIELWVKRKSKSLTRWFTWEQINFNSAVHHALTETTHALSAQARESAILKSEIAALNDELAKDRQRQLAKSAEYDQELRALRNNIDSRAAELKKEIENLKALTAKLSAAAGQRIEQQVSATLQKFSEDLNMRIAAIAAEIHDEQNVCFKQLSLEIGEAAAVENRSLQNIEARLRDLENSPKQ